MLSYTGRLHHLLVVRLRHGVFALDVDGGRGIVLEVDLLLDGGDGLVGKSLVLEHYQVS